MEKKPNCCETLTSYSKNFIESCSEMFNSINLIDKSSIYIGKNVEHLNFDFLYRIWLQVSICNAQVNEKTFFKKVI